MKGEFIRSAYNEQVLPTEFFPDMSDASTTPSLWVWLGRLTGA